MSKPKKPKPKPAPVLPTEKTYLPGGVAKIIQICEDLRTRNTDGYLISKHGGGILANVSQHGSLRVCHGTTCTPFTGTVIGVALDPTYPRDDLNGDPYVPLVNGDKKDRLNFAQFYNRQNANDCAVEAVLEYKLGSEKPPKEMRRGDLVEISWCNGKGHGVFCWDVHLNEKGEVDCFQYLGANGGGGLPGVTISGCKGRGWLTGEATDTRDTGTLGKARDPLFVDSDDVVATGQWLVLPDVAKGSVNLDTFRKKPSPSHIVYSDPAKKGFTAGKIRVGRFWYNEPPPEPYCMKKGTTTAKPADPPGHVDAPVVVVKGQDARNDPQTPDKVPTRPARQDKDKPTEWQLFVEHAMQEFFKTRWIESDPGSADAINDPKTQAAIKEFQKKFKLKDDGIAGPKTRPVIEEQLPACRYEHVAQERLAKLYRGNKLMSDPGPPNGINNSKTRAAVMEFQRMYELDPTGVPDVRTQAKLKEALEEHEPSAQKPGLEPAVDNLYWLGNTVEVGGSASLQLHGTDLQVGQECRIILKDKATNKEMDAAVTPKVAGVKTVFSVPIPSEFGQGTELLARLTTSLPDGKTLELSTPAPLHVGLSDKRLLVEITSKHQSKSGDSQSVKVFGVPGQKAFFFRSKMATDYDGSPTAYHEKNTSEYALDRLANAVDLVIDKETGQKYVQKEGIDLAPGYYVSPSALSNPKLNVDGRKNPLTDARIFVDATKVPYFSLPPVVMDKCHVSEKSVPYVLKHLKFGDGVNPVRKCQIPNGAVKGDLGAVIDAKSRKVAHAILADVGPATELGEGSAALCDALDRRKGKSKKGGWTVHADVDYIFVVFVGSRHNPAWPVSNQQIASEGEKLFEEFGGIAELERLGMLDESLKAWQK